MRIGLYHQWFRALTTSNAGFNAGQADRYKALGFTTYHLCDLPGAVAQAIPSLQAFNDRGINVGLRPSGGSNWDTLAALDGPNIESYLGHETAEFRTHAQAIELNAQAKRALPAARTRVYPLGSHRIPLNRLGQINAKSGKLWDEHVILGEEADVIHLECPASPSNAGQKRTLAQMLAAASPPDHPALRDRLFDWRLYSGKCRLSMHVNITNADFDDPQSVMRIGHLIEILRGNELDSLWFRFVDPAGTKVPAGDKALAELAAVAR